MIRYCKVPYPPTECQLSHGTDQTVSSVRKTLSHVNPAMCFVEYDSEIGKHECMTGYECFSNNGARAHIKENPSDWFVPFP